MYNAKEDTSGTAPLRNDSNETKNPGTQMTVHFKSSQPLTKRPIYLTASRNDSQANALIKLVMLYTPTNFIVIIITYLNRTQSYATNQRIYDRYNTIQYCSTHG
jgi:hypothetical protein